MRELTRLEESTLTTLVKQIHECFDAGYQKYAEAGGLLKKIRDQKLWEKGFNSFKDFFEKTFSQHRQRAYQLIETYEIAKELPKSVSNVLDTERQVRAIGKVPKKKRGKVLKKLIGEGKPITATNIAQAAADPSKPSNPTDDTGYPIPKNCVAIWERRQEIQDLLTAVSELKCEIEKKQKDDLLFAPVSQAIGMHFDQAYYCLSKAKAYAVCPSCEGHPEIQHQGCQRCKNTGLVCKSDYQTLTPQETIKIRERRVDMERARA